MSTNPEHLSFLDSAVEEFLNAFETHEVLTRLEGKRSLQELGRCARNLYVALEKGLKHSLARIDPYLLLTKPEATKLRDLRRDLVHRPVPTIFCSNVR
ncbi:MAG: hypothetical protein KF795_22790, partial [Labilithrix sp.]|nr:hypothetical protein [Labilithrix sp.]